MSGFSIFRSRKYLQSLLLSFIVFVVAILSVFASVLYWSMKSAAIRIQTEANRKVLAQMKYNAEYMDEILKNLTMSLYFDNEVIPMLYGRTLNYGDIATKLAKLDKVADSSTYLHSIVLYNAFTRTYLSTNRTLQDHLNGEMEQFGQQLAQQPNAKKMSLLPVKLADRSSGAAVDFFSYMMYDKLDASGQQSMLILNVKPEWLFNNIKAINDLAYDNSGSVLLMDGSGTMYTSGNAVAAGIPEGVTDRIKRSAADFELFTYGRGKNKSIVTVMSLGVYGWKAVSIQSYDYAFRELRGIRNVLLLVTSLFLLLSAVIAYVISRRLYRPVESMLKLVKGSSQPEWISGRLKDEWTYLSSSYASIMDKANRAERLHSRNRRIVEAFHIRSLLSKSASMTPNDFERLLSEYRLPLDAGGPYMVGVCRIDQFERAIEGVSPNELLLYRFALGNIGEELLSAVSRPVWVDMEENHFVFLASMQNPSAAEADIKAVVQELQQVIRRYYGLSTTFALARPAAYYTGIADAYSEAQHLIQYRMLLGGSTVIRAEDVGIEERLEDTPQTLSMEKQMSEHIRTGHGEELAKDFEAFFRHAKGLTFSGFMTAVLHMTVTVTKTIGEVNENRLRPIAIDIRQFYQQVLKEETADEMSRLFHSLAGQLSDEANPEENGKLALLCRTMKEMVAENSMDPDFSLQSMASMLKMSSAYIGRQFKISTGESVTEYINSVRLAKALELLETSDRTINEVMELAGYRSQSYFFKLFKEKYGTSPKNYRLRKIMMTERL